MDAVNRKMSTVVPLRGRLFSKDLGAGTDDSNPAPPAGGGLQTIDESATTFTDDETLAEEFEVDDEFNLPISVAVTLLLLYMMAGAAVFTIWEKWTFFESFYFVYISLSTIGFGDYVPEHPAFMMCTFIYLLFGLALTSMCINVVQEKLSATFQKAKLRIGATMGLDMTAMMEEELNQDETSVLQMNNNNNNNNNPNPKPILKDEGIGDALREKREKKRKMSAVEKKGGGGGGDDKKEVDGGGGKSSETAADKPKGKGGKSVDFK